MIAGLRGTVHIVGAGPTGALLAILMRRQGMQVVLYDSRADTRGGGEESGRSINLALADRGTRALQLAGVYDAIRPALVPMRGRFVHAEDGGTSFQAYGARPAEIIHSVSRRRLNQALVDIAVRQHGVQLKFEHRCEGADFTAGVAHIRDLRADRVFDIPMQGLLACDGAGSSMRRQMSTSNLIHAQEVDLDHGYKELSIPAGVDGDYRMRRDALHIWPRGDFMLIALPNDDGSFTATLFLPKNGVGGFASLTETGAIDQFLIRHFPDASLLMPDRVREFLTHPTGFLGTVYAAPWHVRGMVALIGDSAHAMVPFHGQGMNCCFEDCLEFDACVGRALSWQAAFAEFETLRKTNTDAIAEMALENHLEMRQRVADPKFQLQQALSHELESRFSGRFIPRYSMVMFHHEIPYRVAQQRGLIQSRLLDTLTATAGSLAEVDFARAAREIESQLPPLA
jgi:kynurenine 3-monooxygenase